MQKTTEIYLILFSSLHLLFLGFSGYSHIFDAKQVTFCLINSVYFILSATVIYIYARKENKSCFSFLKRYLSPAHFCVLLYLIFTLISGFASSNFPYTVFGYSRFEGMFTITFYCLSFLLVSFIPCRLDRAFIVFCCATTLCGILCTIQLSGHNPLSLYPDGMTFYDAGRLYTTAFIGTIGNANLMGAFICIALPLLSVILIKGKLRKRFLMIIPIILLVITSLKMNTDSNLLAVIITSVLTLPVIFDFKKKASIIYFCLLATATAVFLIALYNHAPQNGILYEISEILHGNISDTFGSGRIRIWKNVLSEISDSPIIGKGPDTMKLENFEPFRRYYPDLGKTKTASIDVAHNEFLNILYHQGLLGLLAYLGFIFFTLREWWKKKSNSAVLALGIAFICYIFQSLFTFSMCLTAPYFWICAGIIVRKNCPESTQNIKKA